MNRVDTIAVAEEYKKNKDLKSDELRTLREWAEKQPHLPPITDLELVLFFHSCHFSMERTKFTIDTFYSVKAHFPEMFAHRDPRSPEVKKLMNVMVMAVLPKPTSQNYRIMYCKFLDPDAEHFVLTEQCKLFDMNLTLELLRQGTADGLLLLVDMDLFSFGHLIRMGPATLKKFFYYLQEALPVRLAGLHFINVVSFIDKVMAAMRPFVKKELLDQFLMYEPAALENVYKIIPLECFPLDYGGTAESIATLHENMKKRLTKHAEYFVEAEKSISDESKRDQKQNNLEEIFGLDGSFKKLDID